jgi:hypothetical protein
MRIATASPCRAILAFALGSVLVLPGCGRRAEVSTSAVSTATPANAAVSAADRLIGKWLRADADYVLEVARASPDGSVEARYFNPEPIHVSRSLWKSDGSRIVLFVEMQDRGYPGNYYELLYDPGSDALVGRYNHLGIQQAFDVAFSRIASDSR